MRGSSEVHAVLMELYSTCEKGYPGFTHAETIVRAEY